MTTTEKRMAELKLLVGALLCITSQFSIDGKLLPDSAGTGTVACPSGFRLYEPSGKCYALVNTLMNKTDHNVHCSKLAPGAFVAAPLSSGEEKFFQNMILTQSSTERAKCLFDDVSGRKWDAYYIGAESCERKGCYHFQWILSYGYRQEMVYNNFVAPYPDCWGGNEYCLHYHLDFVWNDIHCGRNFCAVCEFRLPK